MNIVKSCNVCSHVEVCDIYKVNIKHLKELNIKFRVSTIADICPHYEPKKIIKETITGDER